MESSANVQNEAKLMAMNARVAGRALQALTSEERQDILRAIAVSLESNKDEILKENIKDQENAVKMEMSDAMRKRLVLTPAKLATLADGLRSIADQEEPIGKLLKKTQIAEGLVLTQETVPIGVLLIIFESRPDCLPQIAGLSIRSGNGLMLKGGKEAVFSNRILHKLITQAIESASNNKVSGSLIGLVESRGDVADLLKLDGVIDLIIPRGSGKLVKHIQDNTSIPVMGHSEGICHVFIDDKADVSKAIKVVVDSKIDYPAACNAMETLLLHAGLVADERALQIITALKTANVAVFGGPRACELFGLKPTESFKTEYGELACSVAVVDGLNQAIDHIHQFGSCHTEAIVTEDKATAQAFLKRVDAACTFHNCSTRFADGYRFGLGAEVGISTGRIHARGPVGVEGLTTTKWKMTSELCDTAAEFSSKEKSFIHKPLL